MNGELWYLVGLLAERVDLALGSPDDDGDAAVAIALWQVGRMVRDRDVANAQRRRMRGDVRAMSEGGDA